MPRSENVEKLYDALSNAQAEFPHINKTRQAHYGPYADASDILTPLWPILKKYGLAVHETTMVHENGFEILEVTLGHKSGQFVTAQALLQPKSTKDSDWGGCVTYRRRYLYRGILGLAIPEEPDDNDDNNELLKKISSDGLKRLQQLNENVQNRILEFNKVKNLQDLTMRQYNQIIKMINKPREK